MQKEPELRILRIERQGAKRRTVKFGTDPGFLEAADAARFETGKRAEGYAWISRTLCEQEHWKQSKE